MQRTKEDDDCSMPIDSPTYVVPDEQDLLLTDVTEAELFGSVGELLGVQYLSEAHATPSDMLKGIIFGQNKRLMVSLLCKRKASATWTNIFFLVDTGSPHTYLAPSAMNKLAGENNNNICKTLHTLVQSDSVCIECYLSPQDKHFKDVNVLGMEAMSKLDFAVFHMDFQANAFYVNRRGTLQNNAKNYRPLLS